MSVRDPLNFFSPYERLPAGHENQLTRALLLLLRLSPLSHIAWLRVIDPSRRLTELASPSYLTQRRSLPTASGAAGEQADLISVFLAPEHPTTGVGEIAESDRGQVLDAIVDYGGELIVLIENKLFEADPLQAQQINVGTSGLHLVGGVPVTVLLWRDVIEALLALRERGLAGGTEAAILDDFLALLLFPWVM